MGDTKEGEFKQLDLLVRETLERAAPNIAFTWQWMSPHQEPGVDYFTFGVQVAARDLPEGAAGDIMTRAVDYWCSLGLNPSQNRAGTRVMFPEGRVIAVNAGRHAVVIDAGSAPIDSSELDERWTPLKESGRFLDGSELEVSRMLAEGLTDTEIAQRLLLSSKAARHHIAAIRKRAQL